MKLFKSFSWLGFLLFVTGLAANSLAQEPVHMYYALEQDGVVCGYAEVSISPAEYDGAKVMLLDDRIVMNMKALGASIKGKYHFTYHIDPTTGKYFHHTSEIDQGTLKLDAVMEVRNDTVVITSSTDPDTTFVPLGEGTILVNTRYFPHLISGLVTEGASEKMFRQFSEVDGTVNEVVYTRDTIEQLEFSGKTYDALKTSFIDRTTGMKATMWIDTATAYLLKVDHPMRSVYLADSTVMSDIGEAQMDDKIFARVDVEIPDIQAIDFMKVKAKLEPSGLWLTPDGLNVPGQAFIGTVEENLVDGTFEIKHKRYDGAGAPAFPADYSANDELADYLKESDLIESDDSVIIAKAQEITSGATDSWDAFKRLSQWVSDEISYDIPGGGTAKNVYETRLGECGGHSNLLAAFSRAVGIPCRVVWGCMYVPGNGGRFGQHAWNEVYMGEAGWIPVDATAEEIDFVDCGHIRLGAMKSKAVSLNPIKFEILDYHMTGPSEEEVAAAYGPYLGEYQGQGAVLTVLVQNGSLAVDIPNRMVFELKDPDDEGEWYFKLSSAASVSFELDQDGTASTMTINSRMRLPRKADDSAAVIDDSVPEQYRAMLGAYTIPMAGQDIVVVYEDEQLVARAPGNKNIVLGGQDSDGRWVGEVSESAKVLIGFEYDDSGQAIAAKLSNLSICPRIEAPEGK